MKTPTRLPAGILAFIVIFLLVVLLLSQFRGFLQESVLLPLIRLFWVAGVLLRSVDQICIWAVAVFFIALFSLTRLRRTMPEKLEELSGMPRSQGRGRIRFWSGHLKANAGEAMPSRFIASELRRLVLEVLAYRDHLSPPEVSRLVREGRLVLPAEVESVVKNIESPQDNQDQMVDRLQELWHKIQSLFKPGAGQSWQQFEKIAQYLENTMEGMHDFRNH